MEVITMPIITEEMPYHDTVAAIKNYVEAGGDIRSEELCEENLVSILIRNYSYEYGLFTDNPYNDEDGRWPNPKRETELELQKRPSGIVYDLEWIRTHGFDFKEDCHRYLNDPDLDELDSPPVDAAAYPMDAYLFEYLVNNGYRELLDYENHRNGDGSVIDWIWDEIDIVSEDFSSYKDGLEVDLDPLYANAAKLLKMLIYYGCQKRGGWMIEVWPDLRISFPGPHLLH